MKVNKESRRILRKFKEYYNDKTEMYKVGIADFEIDEYLDSQKKD